MDVHQQAQQPCQCNADPPWLKNVPKHQNQGQEIRGRKAPQGNISSTKATAIEPVIMEVVGARPSIVRFISEASLIHLASGFGNRPIQLARGRRNQFLINQNHQNVLQRADRRHRG